MICEMFRLFGRSRLMLEMLVPMLHIFIVNIKLHNIDSLFYMFLTTTYWISGRLGNSVVGRRPAQRSPCPDQPLNTDLLPNKILTIEMFQMMILPFLVELRQEPQPQPTHLRVFQAGKRRPLQNQRSLEYSVHIPEKSAVGEENFALPHAHLIIPVLVKSLYFGIVVPHDEESSSNDKILI